MNIKNLKVFILTIGLFGILFSLKVQAMDEVRDMENVESKVRDMEIDDGDMIKSYTYGELSKAFDNLNLDNKNVEFSVEEAINHILDYNDKDDILSKIKKSDIRGLEDLIYKSAKCLKYGEEKEIKYNFVNRGVIPCELYLTLKLNDAREILITKIKVCLSNEGFDSNESIFNSNKSIFEGFDIVGGREDYMDFDK